MLPISRMRAASPEGRLRIAREIADARDAFDRGSDRSRAVLGALAHALGELRSAAHVHAHFLDRAVHLGDGGGGLLGHLLHGVRALGDLTDVDAHLVNRAGRRLDGLMQRRGAARHLFDGAAELEDRGGRLLVRTREALDLAGDCAIEV